MSESAVRRVVATLRAQAQPGSARGQQWEWGRQRLKSKEMAGMAGRGREITGYMRTMTLKPWKSVSSARRPGCLHLLRSGRMLSEKAEQSRQHKQASGSTRLEETISRCVKIENHCLVWFENV